MRQKAPFNTVIEDELMSFIRKRQRESVEYFPELLDDKVQLKTMLAEYLNGDSKNISFVQNTVEGLNLLVDSLHWEKGDEIIVFEKDFPSNVYPFLKLKKFGVTIRVVEAKDYLFTTEDYLALLTPNTKLLTVSYVNFLTGQVADLKALGDACKSNNTIYCVDSIQGCGALTLDVKENNIDYISNGGHKWMMFPSGLGFVYFSEKLKEMFDDNKEGWLDRAVAYDLFNWENPRPTDGRRFELGSGPDMYIAASRASMEWRVSIGHEFIQNRILSLRNKMKSMLDELNLDLIENNEINFNSGILSFRHNRAEEVFNRLLSRNITLAIRDGILRISPHFYNTEDELLRLTDELKKII